MHAPRSGTWSSTARRFSAKASAAAAAAADQEVQRSAEEQAWDESAAEPQDYIARENEDVFHAEVTLENHNLQGSKRLSHADKQARKLANRGVDRKLHHWRVQIPPEVDVTVMGTRLYFSGPLGSNAVDLLKVDDKGLAAFKAVRDEKDKVTEVLFAGPCKSITRSCRTHVQNRVNGVTRGYLVYMQLAGVGYRVSKSNKEVTYNVSNR
jgi:hypothetical protein